MTRLTLLASAASLTALPVIAQTEDGAAQQPADPAQMEGTASQAQQGETGEMEGMGGSMEQNAQSESDTRSATGTETDYASGVVEGGDISSMVRTSQMVGGTVYSVAGGNFDEGDWEATERVAQISESWSEIGTVTDVVLSPDGQQVGLVVSHGGFLDIGDQTVLFTMEDVRRVLGDGNNSEEINFVTRLTEDELETLPEVDENWW